MQAAAASVSSREVAPCQSLPAVVAVELAAYQRRTVEWPTGTSGSQNRSYGNVARPASTAKAVSKGFQTYLVIDLGH